MQYLWVSSKIPGRSFPLESHSEREAHAIRRYWRLKRKDAVDIHSFLNLLIRHNKRPYNYRAITPCKWSTTCICMQSPCFHSVVWRTVPQLQICISSIQVSYAMFQCFVPFQEPQEFSNRQQNVVSCHIIVITSSYLGGVIKFWFAVLVNWSNTLQS